MRSPSLLQSLLFRRPPNRFTAPNFSNQLLSDQEGSLRCPLHCSNRSLCFCLPTKPKTNTKEEERDHLRKSAAKFFSSHRHPTSLPGQPAWFRSLFSGILKHLHIRLRLEVSESYLSLASFAAYVQYIAYSTIVILAYFEYVMLANLR